MSANMQQHIMKGRIAAAKGAAAYSTFKTGMVLCRQTANTLAHTWKIDGAYADDLFEAAMKVAQDHQAHLPGTRVRTTTGESYQPDERFTGSTWTMMRGIAPGIQARMAGREAIEFRAFRAKDLKTLQEKVTEVQIEMNADEVDIDLDYEPAHYTAIWGWSGEDKGWKYMKDRNSRSFKSVLIPEALQQEIEEDLKRFTESRARLTRLEMPWRRGYLLSGPPGTGKTSLSLAIAGALRFNLASLSLTDMASDGMLRKAVSSLPARTVLVIEDIDANSVSHVRDHNAQQDGALSLSGLLNSLDGFETPEGLVTILTTNHIERLDYALVRSGRMDRTFTVDYIEARELERLFVWFYEQEPPTKAPKRTSASHLSPADIAEIFKQHLDDPHGGWDAAIQRVKQPMLSAA